MVEVIKSRAEFPAKLEFLFKPARYKVMMGGRGSGKSFAAARALLILGLKERHRILCTREVQRSIRDSVHKLLSDQIEELGLNDFYLVLENSIKGANGTEFIFSGLASQTAGSIKSMEGCTRVWCEEAASISAKSWGILIPTIRADDSEIWITFNPELDTDPTYQKFIVNPPTDCVVVRMNYSDNEWFPPVLEQERLHCKATEPEDTYNNVWEGHCRAAVEGAIYATEVSRAQADGRICRLPYDPSLPVHTAWDLGFADNMTVVMVQRHRSEVRVIDYFQTSQQTTAECVIELQKRPYNWGFDFLPHDGFSHDRKSGLTDEKILQQFRRRVKRVPKTDEESRIKIARSLFPRVAFDKDKTVELLECLRRYRRTPNIHGADTSPIHDEFSHGSDAFGYMCQVVREMTETQETDIVILPEYQYSTPGMGVLG